MRVFIVLMLSCATVLGADTAIRVITTVRTNDSGSIQTKDVYTRDGQTNLVRNTSTQAGVLQIRIHRFYYHGLLVGDFVTSPESSLFTTAAGSPCSVGIEFDAVKNEKSAAISSKDGAILDVFMATNGVFYPVDTSLIQKANDVGGDVRKLMFPPHATNTPPAEFRREIEQLIDKYKDK
jgi:hypothetical protein